MLEVPYSDLDMLKTPSQTSEPDKGAQLLIDWLA